MFVELDEPPAIWIGDTKVMDDLLTGFADDQWKQLCL